jgi:hypothetical protein
MDDLDKCLRILRIAITEGDQASTELADRTVDEYLASFPDAHTAAGGLKMLEQALQSDWSAASGARLEFLNNIFAYLDNRRRWLEGQP